MNDEQIKRLHWELRVPKSDEEVEEIRRLIRNPYSPPWYHKRLPFHFDVSLSIGSTMFDFCFWQLPEVLSIGVFWVHLDIMVGGRR